jgi:4-carboxymuconolactone decarboxylase
MSISETARKNREKLLPNHTSTQLVPYTGYPRALNAIRCLNEVIPETE